MTKKLLVDFGCGTNKKEDHIGVDIIPFDGVDVVLDAGKDRFPWDDNSLDGAYASHFVEHLDAKERIHFFNELYRVLKPKAQATIIVPHFASCRAYGDPTHKWPPMGEFFWYYLNKDWRKDNAPHACASNVEGMYSCHFDASWGYGIHPQISLRSQEFQEFAVNFYKEACQDIHATITKKE